MLNPLVCIFLRGGADGLSLVPPLGDDRCRELRPTLAIPAPDDAATDAAERAIDLDGFFGLHPALSPLVPLYRSGEMAIVHAVGSDDDTRSHFEAQDLMEHGETAADRHGSGWLARALRARPGQSRALSAVTLGKKRPESLRGAPSIAVFESAEEHRLLVGPDEGYLAALRGLYTHEGRVEEAGREALAACRRLRAAGPSQPSADYPDHIFGRRLGELAQLLKVDVGVEVATVDLGGWDTHFVQRVALDENVSLLGSGLAAFVEDLGPMAARTTIVVMTEFGRRAYENGSLGTDHGRGSVLFAIGRGVRGGRVFGEWPGLDEGSLEGPGDLRVTTSYTRILAEWARNVAGLSADAVFPRAAAQGIGVFEAP